ncbi:MAG: ATP-binding protein, partial [Bacteroidota bacterium]
HQLRLEKPFEYEIQVAPEIDPQHEMIPPMFVQPFVENAIEHGVLNLKKGGKIELNFKKQGDFISIEVLDNGVGIQMTTVEGTSHSSLSTTIIKERMDLFNRNLRNKINLVVGNQTDESGQVRGTRVELMVPYQRG